MGLSLHYSARLRQLDQLPQFVEEIEDICGSLGWPSQREEMTVEVPARYVPLEPGNGHDPKLVPINGIHFTPPECETVSFIFTPQGWTSRAINLAIADTLYDISPDLIYSISVKTQFAGPDVHIALVTLLKYLEKKYFAEIKVNDEGQFWDTMDKDVLLKKFEAYSNMLDTFVSALENYRGPVADTAEGLAEQLREIMKRNTKGNWDKV